MQGSQPRSSRPNSVAAAGSVGAARRAASSSRHRADDRNPSAFDASRTSRPLSASHSPPRAGAAAGGAFAEGGERKPARSNDRSQSRGPLTHKATSLSFAPSAVALAGDARGRARSAAVRLCSLAPMTELRLVLDDVKEAEIGGGAAEALGSRASAPVTILKVLPSDGGHGSRRQRNREEQEDPHCLRGSLPGTAEIFGSELLPDVDYALQPGSCLAVFSWGGCTLQLRGRVQQEYTAPNAAMKDYLALSSILDARRQIAALRREVGPRVLVVGSSCSGKSSICSVLANYGIRGGWTPVYVELDPRGSTDKPQLQLPPGCLGAVVLESLDFAAEPDFPLVYFYGRTEPPSASSDGASSSYAGGVGGMPSAGNNYSMFGDASGFFDAEQDGMTNTRAGVRGGAEAGAGTADLFEWLCECLSCGVYTAFVDNLRQKKGIVKEEEEKEGDIQRLLAASGMLINAPPQTNLSLVTRLVDIFNVDLILVVDNPSLLRALQDFYKYEELASENAALSSRRLRPRGSAQKDGEDAEVAGDEGEPAPGDEAAPTKSAEGTDSAPVDGLYPAPPTEANPHDDDDEEEYALFQSQGVEVIGVKKMEGAVTVDNARLRQLRRARVLSYFLGLEGGKRLRPQTLRLRLSDCNLVQFEAVNLAPLSALPADYVRSQKQSPITVSPWTGNPLALANALVAVPATRDPAFVKFANVACLIHIFKVEEVPAPLGEEGGGGPTYVAEVHSPALPGGQLPSNIIIVPDDLKGMKFFVDLN
ncbi:polynucleotide 5'-hydroxyl-kinase [Besnoitia besnoiti]|uniref:Polynucleotide 5'-hydroxyl-kinase n=1 Tax=Besnoitia besnoiti TaxID=94643 RepID=A0A2A9M8B8_BESBE|nr:polynucleotide 5'-hydroxyl-kinase [Besnoitia besnoiti]PFH31632.1 polynucleotide 5'-hydroxyl-kinase [Besnoitia besnoiti]